jgi:lipopolysaccharide/colanic/teichoic acid biosynthesis glycosyltransferase
MRSVSEAKVGSPAIAQDWMGSAQQVVSLGRKPDWRFRAFDIAMVVLALPIALPLLIALALLVKIDDPSSPVLFTQTRYGRGGRPFRLFKIRTMVPDAEKLKANLVALSADKGAGFKIENDPRITPPGRWIRKLYLDELPQLLNVLWGDMALVGPRANSYSPDTYEPWQRQRLAVRPGLTGSWQVMLDKPQDFAERSRIDIEYIRTKTFRGDIAILLRTAVVCLYRHTGV